MDQECQLAEITFEALTESRATEVASNARKSLEDAPLLSEALRKALGPVLQVGGHGAPVAMNRGKYLVEFTAEGNAALRNGLVTFLQRTDGRAQATLVSRVGTIQENAVLGRAATQGAAVAISVVHVAILLAVQAQLVTMERSLARIEMKLDTVQLHLDDQQRSRVHGLLRLLRTLGEEMAASDWASDDLLRWKISLDRADTDFHELDYFATQQSEAAAKRINDLPVNATWLGPTGVTLLQQLEEAVKRDRHHQDMRLSCLLGRLAVARLRAALGAHASVDEIRAKIEKATLAAREHEARVVDRALAFTTKLRPHTFESNARRKLRDEACSFREHVERVGGALSRQLAALEAKHRIEVRALLDVDDGTVRNAELLESG
ncbi:hypothetical protein LVJ94_05170 [Pendulispora rubella]|uniref:Uncharacterized protein n=1 Tax=Pendulispora rubella TaxID=2741070 RepID=A0ABZ2L6W9_9BACT